MHLEKMSSLDPELGGEPRSPPPPRIFSSSSLSSPRPILSPRESGIPRGVYIYIYISGRYDVSLEKLTGSRSSVPFPISLFLSLCLSSHLFPPPSRTRCRYITATRDIETVLDSINTERDRLSLAEKRQATSRAERSLMTETRDSGVVYSRHQMRARVLRQQYYDGHFHKGLYGTLYYTNLRYR